jgi:hypothetical protein
VGFLLLISLSLLALFNDLQRYLSPWIFWPHLCVFLPAGLLSFCWWSLLHSV